tara:strand:+ start:4520 stop:5116 length:597 start_codon:yes stop_codon:yes gene_type:complete
MSTYTTTQTTVSVSAAEGAMLTLKADNSINAEIVKRVSDKLSIGVLECKDDIVKIKRYLPDCDEGAGKEGKDDLESLLKIKTLTLQSFNYWLLFSKTCNFDERFNKTNFVRTANLIFEKVKGINEETFALWEEAVEKEWINEQLYLEKSREACNLLKIVEKIIITVDEGVFINWGGKKGYALNPVITDSNGRTYSFDK